MGKVIIGISGNEQEFPTKSGRVYVTVARELADSVRQAGGVPMVIPMGTPDLAKDYIDMIDKLILSGGQHVDPSLYGQKRLIDSNDYLLERDEFELALIEEALHQENRFLQSAEDAVAECCSRWKLGTRGGSSLARWYCWDIPSFTSET